YRGAGPRLWPRTGMAPGPVAGRGRRIDHGRCGTARVPDHVIDEIRHREVRGAVELPREFKRGDRVRILGGPFEGSLALYTGMKPHQRVEVLLSLLGAQQRAILPRGVIAAVQ